MLGLQLLRIWLLLPEKLQILNAVNPTKQKAREDAGTVFDMGIDDIDHLGNRRVRTVGEL